MSESKKDEKEKDPKKPTTEEEGGLSEEELANVTGGRPVPHVRQGGPIIIGP